jgi:hypothetical protein
MFTWTFFSFYYYYSTRTHYKCNNKYQDAFDIFEHDEDHEDEATNADQNDVNNNPDKFQNFLWIHQGTSKPEDFKIF